MLSLLAGLASGPAVAADQAAARGGLTISALVITAVDQDLPLTVLQRGQRYIFWLQFDPAACAPYITEVLVFFGGHRLFQGFDQRQQKYCGYTRSGITVDIAADAALGTYHWGGHAQGFDGADTVFPASFEVVEARR